MDIKSVLKPWRMQNLMLEGRIRSSRSKVFVQKGVLGNFANFLRSATLLKKRLWHSCFPVNFAKFIRTPFLIEHLRWLLLKNYHFQDFGFVKNCLSGTFNYFSGLYYQGNRKNSRIFYMETFWSKNLAENPQNVLQI